MNSIRIITQVFCKLSAQQQVDIVNKFRLNLAPCITRLACSNLHTSAIRFGLEEFFDDEENWGKEKVKVGRSWKEEELRIKSNEDLHKLWYVLLKEKNMLLTMEHHCNGINVIFPNPERIDKVEDSMERLETVVRERNEAYWQLEVGETGERPYEEVTDSFGLQKMKSFTEHTCRQHLNKDILTPPPTKNPTKEQFQALYAEKQRNLERVRINREQKMLRQVLKDHPDTDLSGLRKKFPDANVDMLHEEVWGTLRPAPHPDFVSEEHGIFPKGE